MKKKSDATKERILLAAAELFALHGYHGTTHQMMSDKAEVNIAAINYHFGSKENLYLRVWEYLCEISNRDYADCINPDAPAEEQLREFIQWRVKAVTDKGLRGYLAQIGRREMNKPSPVYAELEEKYMKEKRAWFFSLIRDIVGHDLDPPTIAMVAFCIYSPLIHLIEVASITQATLDENYKSQCAAFWEDKGKLAESIYAFARAGLMEVADSGSTFAKATADKQGFGDRDR